MGEVRHSDFVERGERGFAAFAGKSSNDEPIESPHQDDIESGDGKLGVKTHRLRHVTHVTLGFARALAQNFQRSLNRFDEAEDELYEGRFSAAVGTDDTKRFTAMNREIHFLKNERLRIPEAEVPALDDHWGGAWRWVVRIQGESVEATDLAGKV